MAFDLEFFSCKSFSCTRCLWSRRGWSRAELHYGSILKYASVYTISRAARTSGEATEDPLKSRFLSSSRCKCWTLNVILLHNCSDYLTNIWWSLRTLKTCVFAIESQSKQWRRVHAWSISPTHADGYMQLFPLYILPLFNVYRYAIDCASRVLQLYASRPVIYSAQESSNAIS